jgi:hypothetical protein
MFAVPATPAICRLRYTHAADPEPSSSPTKCGRCAPSPRDAAANRRSQSLWRCVRGARTLQSNRSRIRDRNNESTKTTNRERAYTTADQPWSVRVPGHSSIGTAGQILLARTAQPYPVAQTKRPASVKLSLGKIKGLGSPVSGLGVRRMTETRLPSH